ncbi:hypothetical protein D3C79_808380 [compost metagenome]
MVQWLPASGILPDDHFTLPVPAADADVAPDEAHAYPVAPGADLLPSQLGHDGITLTGMDCADWASAAHCVAL